MLGEAFQDVTVTPLSPFTLQPGMSYWIVVTAFADWSASTPGIAPTGIATSLGYRFGTDPPTGPESIQVSFQVDGTPVSLRARALLAGSAVTGLVVALACALRLRHGRTKVAT